jgi:pimeloyl-ACP methyl ester carboxylesterase
LPGFLNDDGTTFPLRAYLRRLGYDARPWKLGFNLGGVRKMEALVRARVKAIADQTGRKVSIVGWSLGGVYARLAAVGDPSSVRAVVTLGSPLSRDPMVASTGRLYEFLTGEGPSPEEKAAGRLFPHEFDRIGGDIGLPATAIYSRVDGIVNWRACLIPETAHAQNIEVLGASHGGLGANASVLWAVADRLALPEGTYRKFVPRGPFAATYGRVS